MEHESVMTVGSDQVYKYTTGNTSSTDEAVIASHISTKTLLREAYNRGVIRPINYSISIEKNTLASMVDTNYDYKTMVLRDALIASLDKMISSKSVHLTENKNPANNTIDVGVELYFCQHPTVLKEAGII